MSDGSLVLLGGAADAAGRLPTLNGIAHRVVAVCPKDSSIRWSGRHVWTAQHAARRPKLVGQLLSQRGGRLKPGATLEQARAGSRRCRPGWEGGSLKARWSAHVVPLQADRLAAGSMLWILLGAVGVRSSRA